MKRRCYGAEEIGEILESGPDDPRRPHIEECPRCRALAGEYREYIETGRSFPGPDLFEANRKIRKAIGGGGSLGRAGAGGARGRLFASPYVRPALVAVAAFLVAFGVYSLMIAFTPEGQKFITPKEVATLPVDDSPLAPQPPVPVDGGVVLSWNGVKFAKSYDVIVLSEMLVQVARFGPFTDASFTLREKEIEGISKGTPLVWRVEVRYRNGDRGISTIGMAYF